MALPERLPVMLAPARAIVEAVSLRLSLVAPRWSMWLPLALRLPVIPPTLPSPILGLFLVSATDVVSEERLNQKIRKPSMQDESTIHELWKYKGRDIHSVFMQKENET